MPVLLHKLLDRRDDLDLPPTGTTERRLVDWLADEALDASSWTSFHSRTGHAVIERARQMRGAAWDSDPLYRLQVDLAAQVGVATGELLGEISESCGALLLDAVRRRHGSSVALLILIAVAGRTSRVLDLSSAQRLALELRRRGVSPFEYHVEVSSPGLVHDCESLEAAGLVARDPVLRETDRGAERLAELSRAHPTLLRAVEALVKRVEVPTREDVVAPQ